MLLTTEVLNSLVVEQTISVDSTSNLLYPSYQKETLTWKSLKMLTTSLSFI